MKKPLLLWLIVVILLSACTSLAPPANANPLEPTVVIQPTAAPTPVLTPTEAILMPLTYWVDAGVPQQLLQDWQLPAEVTAAQPVQVADIVVRQMDEGSTQWVYALAAPFPTLTDEMSSAEIRRLWQGDALAVYAGAPLLVSADTLAVFRAKWGDPDVNSTIVLADEAAVLEKAWELRNTFALVPFDALNPRWKVLRVDSLTPLDRELDVQAYPLTARFGLTLSESAQAVIASGKLTLPALSDTNRDVEKMSVVLMTGTTALVRATAYMMNVKGIDYPAGDVMPWLQNADIVHISSESSFNQNCPPAGVYDSTMQFCSDPAHIDLFEVMGVDVIELSGNHLIDYGPGPFDETLRMLDERGYKYYAGGTNAETARQAVLLEDHGNRFAFIGCNIDGPEYVFALPDRSGAAQCDLPWLAGEVQRLEQAGYLVIFTFQYNESLIPIPMEWEVNDFRSMAEAGAAVVSGSQAHYPMIMEFYDDDRFIHYGLGNFIFDQMYELGTRQEFIDRHVFYNGQYISTELYTAMLEDYSRPRPMTADERNEFLTRIFKAAGWE